MKRLSLLAFLLVIFALAGCTAGDNSPAQPSIDLASRAAAFVLRDDRSVFLGDTSFTAVQQYDALTGRLEVSVLAVNANGLKAATLILGYPSDSFRLVDSEYAGGMGEDVITAIITKSPEIHLGTAIKNFEETAGVSGDCELFRLTFERGSDSPSKLVSKPPSRPEAAASLSGTVSPQNQVTLRWAERNVGDGNNDGQVGIADITPLAMNYNNTIPDVPVDLADVLADYNEDKVINIQDLSSLAMNFGNVLFGYDVQTALSSAGPFTRIPNSGTPANPTVLRTDINPNPQPANGPLPYVYETQPIDGIVYFRVAPKDQAGAEGTVSNVIMMESLANILSLTIEPPSGEDPWLVITEEAVDTIPGNEQPFANNRIQLAAMAIVEGVDNPVEVTNLVNWSLESGGTFATIGNTAGVDKGLLIASDVGVVRVLVSKDDDFTVSASLEFPIYAISNITLRVVGQTSPADVSVPRGTSVMLEAIGIFDDNDADAADTIEINITPYVSYAIGRPIANEGPPVVYEAGAFDVNTQTGELFTSDAGLLAGFRAFVTVVFPPEAITPVIGEGYRANSNMLTVTLT